MPFKGLIPLRDEPSTRHQLPEQHHERFSEHSKLLNTQVYKFRIPPEPVERGLFDCPAPRRFLAWRLQFLFEFCAHYTMVTGVVGRLPWASVSLLVVWFVEQFLARCPGFLQMVQQGVWLQAFAE